MYPKQLRTKHLTSEIGLFIIDTVKFCICAAFAANSPCIERNHFMIEQLFEFFSGAGKHWALLFVSVFPFIELRGAIPFGIWALGMPWYQAFLLSFAANLLPIPVVYFLTRPLFAALRKTKLFSGFIDRFEAKMMKKSEKVTK